MEAIVTGVKDFSGEITHADDITLVVIKAIHA